MGIIMNRQVLLTMDIDWASEDVISSALNFIKELNVPCILFQTHDSQTINHETSSLFTYELHPNFCENSNHGDSVVEVINYVSGLKHSGKAVRAHKYFMPKEALSFYATNGFKFTLNNYTDLIYHKPYNVLVDTYELNTFFEDGFYIKDQYPLNISYVIERMKSDGIYVFNLHPIHLAFNSNVYSLTREYKDKMTKIEYRNINDYFISLNRFSGYGIRSFLTDLIIEMKMNNFHFISLNEVCL